MDSLHQGRGAVTNSNNPHSNLAQPARTPFAIHFSRPVPMCCTVVEPSELANSESTVSHRRSCARFNEQRTCLPSFLVLISPARSNLRKCQESSGWLTLTSPARSETFISPRIDNSLTIQNRLASASARKQEPSSFIAIINTVVCPALSPTSIGFSTLKQALICYIMRGRMSSVRDPLGPPSRCICFSPGRTRS